MSCSIMYKLAASGMMYSHTALYVLLLVGRMPEADRPRPRDKDNIGADSTRPNCVRHSRNCGSIEYAMINN